LSRPERRRRPCLCEVTRLCDLKWTKSPDSIESNFISLFTISHRLRFPLSPSAQKHPAQKSVGKLLPILQSYPSSSYSVRVLQTQSGSTLA
jgi:hypothetical protein